LIEAGAVDNPFKPPASNVERTQIKAPKPPSVVLAIRLLWASLVVGAISLLPGIRLSTWEGDAFSIAVVVGSTVFFTMVYAALIVFIARRKNWARVLLIVMVMLGWIAMAADSSWLDEGPVAASLDAAMGLVEAYACYLLAFGAGRRWFKEEALQA
jgi:hypothetical protein